MRSLKVAKVQQYKVDPFNMKTLLVTGSDGFIGKNLCIHLEQQKDVEVLRFSRNNKISELKDFIDKSDFIFHIAGINRPKVDSEFDIGNRKLTEDILSMVEKTKRNIPILFTSSIQADIDNAYGRSKLAAENALLEWSKSSGNKVYIYRLPNVFGKWSKPKYNSVVATYCYNIANGDEIVINNPKTEISLVYIDELLKEFTEAIEEEPEVKQDGFCHIDSQHKITLQDLADKITSFKNSRSTLMVPNFELPIDRYLYATYTSYLSGDDFGYSLEMKKDDRGWLAEFIKSNQFGQVFISRTKPGITRGNHWHHTKIEKFLVVDGLAEIEFRDLKSGEYYKYKVNGDKLEVVDIPAGYTHSITNIGKGDMLTLFWSDEVFNPDSPDTYYKEV
jgi:UDP-2-acetamido-2,6-beta-L-arabino-hexul-4-ose reductase